MAGSRKLPNSSPGALNPPSGSCCVSQKVASGGVASRQLHQDRGLEKGRQALGGDWLAEEGFRCGGVGVPMFLKG